MRTLLGESGSRPGHRATARQHHRARPLRRRHNGDNRRKPGVSKGGHRSVLRRSVGARNTDHQGHSGRSHRNPARAARLLGLGRVDGMDGTTYCRLLKRSMCLYPGGAGINYWWRQQRTSDNHKEGAMRSNFVRAWMRSEGVRSLSVSGRIKEPLGWELQNLVTCGF